MTWHELPELPKLDTEVLAKVEEMGYHYVVLKATVDEKWWFKWDDEEYSWWATPLVVKRWAYIEEE